MSPRNRRANNHDLAGTHLQVIKSKLGKEYFYYIHPDGSRDALKHPSGRHCNRKEAKEIAAILNQKLYKTGDIATAILNKTHNEVFKENDLNQLIQEFTQLYLAKKTYSGRSLQEIQYKLKNYQDNWGNIAVKEINTQHIVKLLNPLSDHAYIKHRSLLTRLFAFAIHQGYINHNPVSPTLSRTEPKRKRKQHSREGYQAIYSIAPDWLKRAMNIALYSVQRRGDLTRLHHDQINLKENTLTILQQKTRNYDHPVYIEIVMIEPLRKAVIACMESGTNCPYLIHYRPKRISEKQRNAKLHPFSVTDNYLTKQFAIYRNKSGAYDPIPAKNRPTFHSIRGFGAWLYEQQGFDKAYIQLLTGHASEKMLDHYLSGHEANKPVRVSMPPS